MSIKSILTWLDLVNKWAAEFGSVRIADIEDAAVRRGDATTQEVYIYDLLMLAGVSRVPIEIDLDLALRIDSIMRKTVMH